MKKNLLVAALLVSAVSGFAQGTIAFNNRQTTAGTGGGAQVIAPIFGVNPNNPLEKKQGNPTAAWNGTSGPTPVPLGTQTYAGIPLSGTGFTATLWAANSTKPDDQLVQIASTGFRVSTSASLQGFITSVAPQVPDTASDPAQHAKFQMRVWDNRGGQITSWAQVLADNSIPRGESTIFTVPFQLGGGSVGAPSLIGLESFQLYTVPEPSVIALGVLGAGCLFLLRRRK